MEKRWVQWYKQKGLEIWLNWLNTFLASIKPEFKHQYHQNNKLNKIFIPD
jgi:hypothetical protein